MVELFTINTLQKYNFKGSWNFPKLEGQSSFTYTILLTLTETPGGNITGKEGYSLIPCDLSESESLYIGGKRRRD
jgi:hypothetical protein